MIIGKKSYSLRRSDAVPLPLLPFSVIAMGSVDDIAGIGTLSSSNTTGFVDELPKMAFGLEIKDKESDQQSLLYI